MQHERQASGAGPVQCVSALHMHKELQRFQIMKHWGCYFQLTHLSFGLNCSPKIMMVVLAKVLSLGMEIDVVTDHYIDDR